MRLAGSSSWVPCNGRLLANRQVMQMSWFCIAAIGAEGESLDGSLLLPKSGQGCRRARSPARLYLVWRSVHPLPIVFSRRDPACAVTSSQPALAATRVKCTDDESNRWRSRERGAFAAAQIGRYFRCTVDVHLPSIKLVFLIGAGPCCGDGWPRPTCSRIRPGASLS